MNNQRRFENIVRKDLDVRARDGTYDRMRDIVLSAHGPTKTTESAMPILKGRTIMRNPIAKLAVAAALLTALGLGVWAFLSTGHHSGVVWAQVADRVNASGGFIYRTRTIQTDPGHEGPIEFTTMTYNSPAHGLRIEGIEGAAVDSYTSYDNGTRVSLFHDMKRYTQHTLPPRPAGAEAEPPAGAMAKAMIQQFTFGGYRELGRRTIDGVEAEGIETENPLGFGGNFPVDSVTAQLWVSVETGYPVLMKSNIVGINGTLHNQMIMDQFQWDVDLDPSEFTAEIPPDYEPLNILPGGGMGGGMEGVGGMGGMMGGGMGGSSDSQ